MGRFTVDNLTVTESGAPGIYDVEGELTNDSGRNYASASFAMDFTDAGGKPMGTVAIVVHDFADGDTVDINDTTDRDVRGWSDMKVRLVSAY